MTSCIEGILDGQRLSVDESRSLMHMMVRDEFPLAQVAAILTTFRVRGMSVDLLDGFSQALLELATPVDLGSYDLIDVCGTGGDGKNSFNISTTVAFILAGAGYTVAKHGNGAASSSCGSSNALEALGISLTADSAQLRRSLEASGVCFLHAPLFHPSLKRIGPLRRELGFKTVFNALGPLVNPARPQHQCTGVYSLELQRLYSALLQRRQANFAVVHSLDGYDEVSLTGPVRVVTNRGNYEFSPECFGCEVLSSESLQSPGGIQESAVLVKEILEGRASPSHEDVTCANAALAMWSYEGKGAIAEYMEKARESVRSGRALRALKRSQEV